MLSVLHAPTVLSATYYVSSHVANDLGNGSRQNPKKFIASGIALMSEKGGDVLILADGGYSDVNDNIVRATKIRNGKPGAYNVIRAESDGRVILKGRLELPLDSAYLQFEGLNWNSPHAKGIAGHHLKFLRCSFNGGPSTGNSASVSIGTIDQTPGAQYILLEDSWVYGPGGRYKILIFNAEFVVLRRTVVRHDGGWTYDGQNPQGGITIYNSKDVQLQNAIVFDSDLQYVGWEAGIYLVKNSDAKTVPFHTGTYVRGSIVFNLSRRAIGVEGWGRIQGARFEDSVIWNASEGLSLNNGTHSAIVRGMTVGKVGGTAFAIWGGAESSLDVRNSIVAESGTAFRQHAGRVTHSFNNCFRSGSCSSVGESSIDPKKYGLLYLPRIEQGSRLKSGGEDMRQVGAEIFQRIGRQGTLFGEPGYDQLSKEELWPWPEESRLKEDLCANGVSRGFCKVSLSLTEYLWNHLGSAFPVKPAPGNAEATRNR